MSSSIQRVDYPYLRQCMSADLAVMPTYAIEALMADRFGEGAAEQYDEYLEGFFDDIGKTLSRAAPIITNVAGGVARGAMSGSSLGLPGIIGGAVAGGAGTALGSYAKGPLRDVGNALNTATHLAGSLTPMGRLGQTVGSTITGLGRPGAFTQRGLLGQGASLLTSAIGSAGGPAGGLAGLAGLLGGGGGGGRGNGGGAAGQLMSLIRRPELQQALAALNLGQAGRPSIPVGAAQRPVPAAAIAGLLQSLAGRALGEAAAESDGSEAALGYMMDDTGEMLGDPTQDNDRAARVWALLNQAQQERLLAAAHHHAVQDASRAVLSMREDLNEALAEDVGEAFDFGAVEHFTEDFLEDFTEEFGEDLIESYEEEFGDSEDLQEDFLEDFAEDFLPHALTSEAFHVHR